MLVLLLLSMFQVQVQVILRPTVSRQSGRHPSGTRDQFFPFSLWLFLDSFGLVDVESKSNSKSKSKLYYDRRSVGQSLSVSGTHLGPTTNFSHSLFDFSLQFRVCWCGVKVKVILRPTVSRPVRLCIRHPPGTRDKFFPLSLWFFFFFLQFRVCWCEVPSLVRSRTCTFQFLPGIASAAFLRYESDGTHAHSLLFIFLRLPQPEGPGSCIYFPQEQGSPIIPSGIGACLINLHIITWYIYSSYM
jgi:hypothetical protein